MRELAARNAATLDTLVLRTRPTTVEARKVTETNRDELARWTGGWTYGVSAVRWFDKDSGLVVSAQVGDWIVRTAFGRFVWVTDALIFREYERVVAVVSE